MIVIGSCPTCVGQKLPIKECKSKANPDCEQCKGSGIIEIDKEKRLKFDRGVDDMLDKMDKMDELGIDYDSMSDEEFENWQPEYIR